MAKITLKGNEVNTNSDIVSQGSDAPDFILVNSDLQDVNLSSFDGKNKILSIKKEQRMLLLKGHTFLAKLSQIFTNHGEQILLV